MKYYKVKPQYDNYKLSRNYEIFVGNELLTEAEYKTALLKFTNRNNPRRQNNAPTGLAKATFAQRFDIVEIPKNKTYCFFGARFAQDTIV